MKILSILIKNLASLEGESVIDFSSEPLVSAGIFAITGPTGAGKSTILDALCLALYAKTPRYRAAESGVEIRDVQGSVINQNDIRGILRDGCAEGIAEVKFVGVDGNHYKASWSVRRARNKIDGALQADNVQLSNLSAGTVFPAKKRETLEEIERVVGLNFEQFTRSVLLAQGDFTAFLKAARDEKSSLLEKLTGTHIYSEISRKVFERHKEEMLALRDLNLRMEGIVTLSDEERGAFQDERERLSGYVKEQQQQIVGLEREISWHASLFTLQESLAQAQDALHQAEMMRADSAERIAHFRVVVDVQELRPIQQSIDKARLQLVNCEKELSSQQATLSDLQQTRQMQEEGLLLAKEKLERVVVEQASSATDLITARGLDVQLRERAELLQLAKGALADSEAALQELIASLVSKETALETIEQDIRGIEKWQIDNDRRKIVAEQSALISSHLRNAGAIVELVRESEVKLAALSAKRRQEEEELVVIKNRITAQEQSFQELQEKRLVLENQMGETSFEQLQEQRNALESRWRTLIDIRSRWIELEKTAQERSSVFGEVDVWTKRLNDESARLNEYRAKLVTLSVQKEVAEGILSKARLAAAADVKHLRSELKEAEPCPVCGSEHHPYSGELKMFDVFLQEQESIFTDLLLTFNSLGQQVSSSEALVQRNQEELRIKSGLLKEKELMYEELKKAWNDDPVSVQFSAIPGGEQGAYLAKQIEQATAELEGLKKYISEHELLRKEMLLLHESSTRLQTELNDLKMHLQKQLSTIDRMKDEEFSVEQVGRKAVDDLEALREELAQYFESVLWFENWKKNPEDFVGKILLFSAEWKTNLARMEQGRLERTKLASAIESLRLQKYSFSQNTLKAKAHFDGVEESLFELRKNREILFEGRAVEEIEMLQKQTLELANMAVVQLEKDLQETLSSFTKVSVFIERLSLDKDALCVDIKNYIDFQLKWIFKYTNAKQIDLAFHQLESLLRYEHEWIAAENRFVEELERRVQEANVVSKEREKDLLVLQGMSLSFREKIVVEGVFEEAKKKLQESLNRQSEIDWRLRENEQNIMRVSSVLEALGKQAEIVEDWAKLNEVLGSADGKKFRQIAQEYTLDILLGYANIHLQVLSSRYILERISGSLSLQIIDKDMGDEVRTIYSLSGGESFLVSLALALGLASLSSAKMQVESLFIDEGFGSLDPLTLNIAMDALERLHNQGRKVGIISHVQEMTERIPVQIRVNKQHSGRSQIEII